MKVAFGGPKNRLPELQEVLGEEEDARFDPWLPPLASEKSKKCLGFENRKGSAVRIMLKVSLRVLLGFHRA